MAIPAGGRDTAVGPNGQRALAIAGADLYPVDLLATPSGKVFLLAFEAGAQQARVFKLTANLAPDPGFGGGDGVAEVPLKVLGPEVAGPQPQGSQLAAADRGGRRR